MSERRFRIPKQLLRASSTPAMILTRRAAAFLLVVVVATSTAIPADQHDAAESTDDQQVKPPTPRLPRDKLLIYRGDDNEPQPVRTTDEWLKRRAEILGGMQAVMGKLAERGYVTLAPSYPLLANYQPDVKALGWESGTLKAVWDNIRGLDLLESLPFVEKGAFGAIGHSLGGHNAVYTSVFDDRIKVVVSSCGLDSFLDYYGGDEKVWLPRRNGRRPATCRGWPTIAAGLRRSRSISTS